MRAPGDFSDGTGSRLPLRLSMPACPRRLLRSTTLKARRVIPSVEKPMKARATIGELRHLLRIVQFPLGFTTVGSGPECDVCFTGSGIEPLHACILAGPSGVVLCDLSAGGVRVNGSAVPGATLLKDRDRLHIGGERFVFVRGPSSAAGGPRNHAASGRSAVPTPGETSNRPSGTCRATARARARECLIAALRRPGERDAT